ncbi:MAG: cytochrome c biogenesis protein CcdA [Nitrospirota bacterium]|jgi:thiol:disulfide interchange protein DsbD
MSGMETYLAGSPLVAVGAAFASGILAGLSPCVYPMIPIVTGYVGGRAVKERAFCEHCGPVTNIEAVVAGPGGRTRARYFFLSLGYVFGMAAVYSLLGMIAALTGDFFGRISTSPWALLFVANIFILFALNLLDAVPFPAWFQGRSMKPAMGGVIGAFLIGAVSGLVASPCTSPVLFALLTFVATSRSVVYGGVLLFAFSMGMGILLIIAGTFSGLAAALPKPGGWMIVVKKVIAVLMLGLAEYYIIKAGQAWL